MWNNNEYLRGQKGKPAVLTVHKKTNILIISTQISENKNIKEAD